MNGPNLHDHVVLLVGGVGGAKLAVGLADVLPPEALTIIVNTADDFEHLGLYISPDLDTVTYSLSGWANPINGWGIRDDAHLAMEMISLLGGPDWFRLGDRDLGTNLVRSSMLRAGSTLTQATAHITHQLGIDHIVLPMTDAPVRTTLHTDRGVLAFQEYFVRERWQPVVKTISFQGAEIASPSDAVKSAIEAASLIIFGPSNPYLSIDPILFVPGIRERIMASTAPCVAVSPIIGGQAIKGPAAKLMGELGIRVSSEGIADHYKDLLDGFILDSVDENLCDVITSTGIQVMACKTLMESAADKTELANTILKWTEATFP